MHPVLENIAARQNKKIPVKDGRKIALVLFGGLMTGVRGAGAGTALLDLGLIDVFDRIYTMSAGFCNASYFLAKQPRYGSTIYFDEMTSKNFIQMSRVWNMVDTDFIIDVIMNKKKLDIDKIFETKTKLYTAMYNVGKKKVEYVDVLRSGPKKYLEFMRAAVSIPYLHPGSVKIGKRKYKDYPVATTKLLQDFVNYVVESDATDIFVIYNNAGQVKIPAVFSDRVYEVVVPRDRPLSHFETNRDKLKEEWYWMYDHVRSLFPQLKIKRYKEKRNAKVRSKNLL